MEEWDKRERVGGWGLGWRCLKGGAHGGISPRVSAEVDFRNARPRSAFSFFFLFFELGLKR